MGVKYIEVDFYDQFVFKKAPFKITSLNREGEMDNTFIAILAEYKHGANDHTIKGQELVPLSTVLMKIEQQTNTETKFKIETTSSFPCLIDCMHISMVHKDPFAQKIINKKLPAMRRVTNTRKKNTKVLNSPPTSKSYIKQSGQI